VAFQAADHQFITETCNMHNENLIKMANDISNFFGSDPDHATAIKGMVDHLRKFWEPRMREAIIAHYHQGGEGLSDLSKDAIKQLDIA
jgi:formate dehydrogenase subunit delta